MDNYERTLELVEIAQDSEGRSSQQFAKYSESLEYSVTQLKNTWEQFRIGIADSDFYKGLIKGANELLETITHFDKLDWSGLLLVFFTVGRSAVNSFISGMRESAGNITKFITNIANQATNATSSAVKTKFENITTRLGATKAVSTQMDSLQRQYNRINYVDEIARTERNLENLRRNEQRFQIKANYMQRILDRSKQMPEWTQKQYLKEQGFFSEEEVRRELARSEASLSTARKRIAMEERAQANYTQKREGSAQESQAIERQQAELRQRIATNAVSIYQAAGAVAGMAFTTAFTTTLTTHDPGVVLQNTLISAIVSAVPQINNLFTTGLANGGLGQAFSNAWKGGLAMIGVTAVIAGAAYGANAFFQKIERDREKSVTEQSAFHRTSNALEELAEKESSLGQKANEAAESAKKLSEEYNSLTTNGDRLKELSEKVVLTSEEQEELNNLSKEMAELVPNLISGYDNEGNAVINLGEAYDELVKKKKEALAAAQYDSDLKAYEYGVNQFVKAETELAKAQSLYNQISQNSFFDELKRAETSGSVSGLYYFGFDSSFWNLDYEKDYSTSPLLSVLDSISNLNKDQRLIYGELFKEIFEGTTVNVSNEDATKIPKDIFNQIYDLLDEAAAKRKEQTEESIKTSDELLTKATNLQAFIQEKIQNVSDSFKVLEQDIRVKQEELNNYRRNVIQSSLVLNSDYYKSQNDKNVQRAMEYWIASRSGLTADALRNQYEAERGELDFSAEGTSEAYSEWLTNKLKDFNFTPQDEEDLKEAFSAQVIAAWAMITDAITRKENITKIAAKVAELITDPTQQASWVEANRVELEKSNTRVETIASLLGEETKTVATLGEGDNALNVLGFSNEAGFGAALYNLGTDAFDKFAAGFDAASEGKGGKAYLNLLSELYEGMGAEDFERILSAPWEDYSIIDDNTFRKNLEEDLENTKSAEVLEKYWDSVVSEFANREITMEGALEILEGRSEALNSYISAWSKAASSSIEDGYVDASAIKTLRKAGAPIEKLINEDYTFNQEAAKVWIEELIQSEADLVALAKERVDLQYKNVSGLKTALEHNRNITKEEAIQLAHSRYGYSYEDANNLLKNWDEKTSNEITIQALRDQITALDDVRKDNEALAREGMATVLSDAGSFLAETNKIAEKEEKKTEEIQKANEQVEKAYETLLDKQQDLIDKQNELNKVLYGESTHKGKLDELYNYQTAIEKFKNQVEEAKEALEDLDGRNPSQFIEDWLGGTHNQIAYLTAENNRYANAVGATESMLRNELSNFINSLGYGMSANIGDFFGYNPLLDRYELNQSALGGAAMNSDLKDFVEEQVDLLNEYKQSIDDNNKEIKQLEKEFEEYQKKIRDNYISVQNEIVEKLKESYQKQIKDKENMYEALEKADSDYLEALEEAINKQRQLRDQQDKWNDLSTKEKRLSLLQRDTSGANKKESTKLQKEIEKDRRAMLDDAVDNIVDQLKELYDEQQKSRDAEIEYQQSVLDNANLVVEANAIMESWKSMDEMVQWMWEHTEGIENMSDQAVEKLTEDWQDMFDNIVVYNELQQKEVKRAFEVTGDEVENIVINTTESLTNEASRALGEISDSVSESIQNAEQAVADTMKSLTEAQTAYNEAIEEYQKLINGTGNAVSDFMLKLSEALEKITGESTTFTLPQAAQDAYNKTLPGYYESLNNPIPASTQEALQKMISEKGLSAVVEDYAKEGKTILEDLNHDLHVVKNEEVNGLLASGKYLKKYKKGGLADYTGLAWVDGTKRRPEGFLNAEDTERIGEAANIFASLASFGSNGTIQSGLSATIGDTNVEMHFHIESIATEDQVDYLIDRVKEEFVEVANPIGSSVILRT